MPFNRPSIQVIWQRVRGDMEGALTGSNAWLRRNLTSVIAKMIAGVSHGLHGSLDWLAKNLLPITTDPTILAIWARVYGVPRLDPTFASGTGSFSGTPGAVLPAGSIVLGPNDIQYVVQADITIDGGGAGTGEVVTEESGAAGNLDEGAPLSLVVPEAGINSTGVVSAGGLNGGADIESIESWQSRLLSRIQQPPQGGSLPDYYRWVREAHPSVTDVWVKPHAAGIGTITMRFMTYGATADGVPTPQVVQAVFDYVDGVRPVKAKEMFVFAPEAFPMNYEIAISPNTAAVRDAVTQQLAGLLRRSAAPGYHPPISHVNEAISLADGEEDHQILSPLAVPTLTPNQIPVLGDIVWSDL